MPLYSVRVDCLATPLEHFKNYCLKRKSYKGNCLMVHEISTQVEKPHIHLLIADERSESAYRADLLKHFPRDGKRKEYMLKTIALDTFQSALQYLCKGEGRGKLPTVIYASDFFTETEIKTAHNLYWDFNDSIRRSNNNPVSFSSLPVADSDIGEVRTVKQPRKEKKKFLLQVCERIESMGNKDTIWNLEQHAKIWHKVLIQMHGQNFAPYNAHQIDKELNAIAAYFCIDEMIEQSRVNMHQYQLPWSRWLG